MLYRVTLEPFSTNKSVSNFTVKGLWFAILKMVKLAIIIKNGLTGGNMSLTNSAKIDVNKYENAILYFVEHCNNKWLGTTKLNKLLYYLDFISYRDRGSSATFDTYRHLDKGPVPKNVVEILQKLKNEGKLEIKEVPYLNGTTTKFNLISKADTEVFDEYEEKLLHEICKVFKDWSTPKIVDQTHLESPWLYSKMFDDVDYEYAYDIDIIDEKVLTGASSTR